MEAKKIYKITNIINKKIYIGKTIKTLETRFKEHCSEAVRYKECCINNKPFGYNSKLYPAMLKYGCENFVIELVENVPDDVDINEQEKYWISYFNSLDDRIGYNISPGGLGGPLFKNHRHNEKTKELISKKSKGKKQSADFIKRRTVKRQFKYQNLNTGDIFIGLAAASKVYSGSIGYAVRTEGKADGYFWIKLPKDHPEGYNEQECLAIIKNREENLHNIYSQAGKKAWKNRSEEVKKEAIAKAKISTKNTIKNRTPEKNKIISMHISEARKGKKHSVKTIEKLKNYYKQASEEELMLRRLRISEGQKGKKRYEDTITKKHKMFYPGQEPEGWVQLSDRRGGAIEGKRKYRNKVTGICKMFLPNEVDLMIWEKVVKDDRKNNF